MTSWDLLLCNSLPICLQSSTVAGLKLLHKIVHMPSQMYFHSSTHAFTACTVLTSITAPPTITPRPLTLQYIPPTSTLHPSH